MARLASAEGAAFDDTVYGALPTGECVCFSSVKTTHFLKTRSRQIPLSLWKCSSRSPLGHGRGFRRRGFRQLAPQRRNTRNARSRFVLFFGRTPFDIAGEEGHAASLERTESESPLL